MLINNTTNKRVTGVVKEPEVKAEYTGATTSTAKVTVDKTTKEIKVDVISSGFLGETSTTAYPGNDGALANKIAHKAARDVEAEQARAIEAEQELKQEIRAFEAFINKGDANAQKNLEAEVSRAKSVEQILDKKINSVEQQVVNNNTSVNTQLEDIRVTAEANRRRLAGDIRQLEDDVFDELTELSDEFSIQLTNLDKSLTTKILSVENELSTDIHNLEEKHDVLKDRVSVVEETYATKLDVYKEVTNAVKLSKQLVDSVDLINNKVIINNEATDPVDGILYMVLDASAPVEDIYKEYTTINGQLTLIGDTSTDLRDYATLEYVDTKSSQLEKYVHDTVDAIDLTPYAKTEDLPTKLSEFENDADYAKKSDIPDVSSFIAEIPAEYITESELAENSKDIVSNITALLQNIEFIDGGKAPL